MADKNLSCDIILKKNEIIERLNIRIVTKIITNENNYKFGFISSIISRLPE